jgi:hypothetical protein
LATREVLHTALQAVPEAYMMAKQCQYVATEFSQEINRSLNWLNRIDNSDWLPPAIQFLSQKKNEPEYVLWFFTKLERLAACLHICAKNVNQRIERYAEVLNELEKHHSLAAPLVTIELRDEEKEAVREVLNGKIYELTARRRNYLILRLDSFLTDGAATYDPAVLTIEHVLPQTVGEGSPWLELWPDEAVRNEWIHRLANLVPLTQKRNSAAQNYGFDKKKEAYFGGKNGISSYALTTQVLKTPEWSTALIRTRQTELLSVLDDGWELTSDEHH